MAAIFQVKVKSCQVFDVESHSSENFRTLNTLGEVFSMELQLFALERQQNNNSKTTINNDTLDLFQDHCHRPRRQKHSQGSNNVLWF